MNESKRVGGGKLALLTHQKRRCSRKTLSTARSTKVKANLMLVLIHFAARCMPMTTIIDNCTRDTNYVTIYAVQLGKLQKVCCCNAMTFMCECVRLVAHVADGAVQKGRKKVTTMLYFMPR